LILLGQLFYRNSIFFFFLAPYVAIRLQDVVKVPFFNHGHFCDAVHLKMALRQEQAGKTNSSLMSTTGENLLKAGL